MTHRDHLEVRKWGVKGPPILCSKNGLPWDISDILWSKIWGTLNPTFSHLQMIPLGHMNIPKGLFLENNFISIHPIWLNSAPGETGMNWWKQKKWTTCFLIYMFKWIRKHKRKLVAVALATRCDLVEKSLSRKYVLFSSQNESVLREKTTFGWSTIIIVKMA